MMVSVFLFLLLPVAAFSVLVDHASLPEDCEDVYTNGSTHSGVYTICPAGTNNPIQVYCDMDCEDDDNRGGWTVFQRRLDGTVNFYRPWEQYKNGFGIISGEHWLGLQKIFAISWTKKYRLRVDMEDFEGGSVHAEYTSFSIEPESDGYRLRLGDYVDGGAGNALVYSNGRRFSTFDKEQTDFYRNNYAERYHGGFWFGYNDYVNPNGLYKWGPHTFYGTGVWWNSWKRNYAYSLKTISMKIRPVSLESINNVFATPWS